MGNECYWAIFGGEVMKIKKNKISGGCCGSLGKSVVPDIVITC